MPLSEFLRMARGKLESSQQKPGPTNFSSRSENGLVELVWNNGQIGMQGPSSRGPTRSPTHNARNESSNARFVKFGGVESILNDMAPVVPSGDLDLGQDDEMAPWLSYDDHVGRDYVSDLLPEISGVTANGMSAQNSFVSMDKTRTVGNTLYASSNKDHRLLSSWPPQGGNVMNGSTSMSIRPPTNSSNFLNFSHFSRAANLVKANGDGIERVEVKEKGSVKEIDFHGSSAKLAMVDSREPQKGSRPDERTDNLCQETCGKNEKPPILDNSRKGVPDGERNVEPMVACSSVGSGNSVDRVSCEQTQNSKRKFVDIEESECRSDDVETESLDVKRGTCIRGSKRGRAAEVHNLSERRRRDRINEKMRALQELIPNCNKADKASMLDEAIEYLKSLQLQVQIMSMGTGLGTGLYIPPMMFPTGMQHMYPHFPPMGVGMGYGPMGMVDMNGGASSCPIFPVPSMQVAHFPPQMPGFQRMPGQNGPVFVNPSQGPPSSVPRAPFGPLGLGALRNGNNGEVPSSIMNPRDPMRTINPQPTCNAEAGSINNRSDQATNEALEQCISVQETNQVTDSGGPPAAPSSTTTDISKEPG